jgi:hypothetical protein
MTAPPTFFAVFEAFVVIVTEVFAIATELWGAALAESR